MKSNEEIIDAEFVDLPNSLPIPAPRMPRKRIKTVKPRVTEGRIDKLATGLLQAGYEKMTGAKPNDATAGAIEKAVDMLIGKTQAKGPEWDFLKSLMKG